MVPPVVDRPLFFLDYDGTLAPIVDDPMQAVPHPEAPALLTALAAAHPLWIVTGRYLRDLDALLGLPLRAIGLHGAQEGAIGGRAESLVPAPARAAIARLRGTLPEIDGLHVEEKGPTFAVHYRAVADEAATVAALRTWSDDRSADIDVLFGKKVVELRPRGFSKGIAVRRLADAYPDRTPLYLGDDVTDEDAFAALPDDAVTVKVGAGETIARYRLPDVPSVVDYLRRYV